VQGNDEIVTVYKNVKYYDMQNLQSKIGKFENSFLKINLVASCTYLVYILISLYAKYRRKVSAKPDRALGSLKGRVLQ